MDETKNLKAEVARLQAKQKELVRALAPVRKKVAPPSLAIFIVITIMVFIWNWLMR